jgi:hypothetical protein
LELLLHNLHAQRFTPDSQPAAQPDEQGLAKTAAQLGSAQSRDQQTIARCEESYLKNTLQTLTIRIPLLFTSGIFRGTRRSVCESHFFAFFGSESRLCQGRKTLYFAQTCGFERNFK